MADATADDEARAAAPAAGAGALLREARQRQGLHIAALAASIKLPPAKLEALEAGRYGELPDAAFTRALALTLCRVLKIDPAPVLAQLPDTPDTGLARVDSGLNTPFRERPGRIDPTVWLPWRHPVLWIVAFLLVAAAAFVLVPSVSVVGGSSPAADATPMPVMPPAAPAASVPEAGEPAAAAAPEAPASAVPGAAAGAAPAAPAAASAAATAASAAGDALVLRAVQTTWVQVVDGGGQTQMERLVPAGETVALTATPPLRLRIGNASGTELSWRGQPVDLKSIARNNIANLTLP
ncbi:MAG: helix-turn-helix domain-containing protein [Burkholderiaceae bacterium]|nr:helix-turn-helix domain-containing protein [Burkholderiaceae bacterium]